MSKRKAPWAALSVLALITATACTSTPSPSLPTRDRQWQQDIAYVAANLPRDRYAGLGSVSRQAWNAAASRLEAQVPHRTDGQLLVGLAQMIAMLHDDETLVQFPQGPVYPVYSGWVGNGLYLLGVPGYARALLGGELLAVDGHPLSAVLARISTTIDHQDLVFLKGEEAGVIDDGALLNWLGIASSPSSVTFTVRTASGRVETARIVSAGSGFVSSPAGWLTQLKGLAVVPLPLYQQDAASPYWMKVLPAQHAVFLKYNRCLSGEGFQRLAAQALTLLKMHPRYRLIVDLRDNRGGDTAPFQSLITGIQDPGIGPGRVAGLVNQYTASSATADAQVLKQTGAVLIGQTPAMTSDTWGNDMSLALPGPGITVQYTSALINSTTSLWGIPDLTVAPTLAQIMAGDDPVLAAALSYRSLPHATPRQPAAPPLPGTGTGQLSRQNRRTGRIERQTADLRVTGHRPRKWTRGTVISKV